MKILKNIAKKSFNMFKLSMKVSAIIGQVTPKKNSNVTFGRKLKEDEKADYTKAINQALDYLGVKNLSMIIHGSSFPSDKRDTSVGSPYSKGSEKFVDFLKMNGFNAVQLGPGGSIDKKDNSPYISKVFAKNELFIDLEQLKTSKYANILSEKTYNELTTKNKDTKDRNYNYSDFNKAFNIYDKATDEAYKTFKSKYEKGVPEAVKLNKEFENFKKENSNWVEYDGIYKVLTNLYGTKDYEKWTLPEDKNLPVRVKSGDKKAKARYDELLDRYHDDIEKNSFTQFIADKQLKDNNERRKQIGFNYIGDLLVGFSESDVWANQNAFLKDWKLGCPFGGVNNGPQTWGIPVLDPKKLFNEDGSLGVSGKVLQEKMEYSLKNYDNVRIDHALGLVDPYIYKENTIEKTPQGEVRRDKLCANNVSYLKEVDPNGNFKKVLKKIVLPTFKKYGADKNQAVWEDLCSKTETFNDIYYRQEHLPGITQTEWQRVENTAKGNWSLVGSHDSKPARQMNQNADSWNVDYLSGYLNPDPAKGKERAEYRQKIVSNPVEKTKAKFTELFRGTENLQMMFVDFFGIDKVYNHGGQNHPDNWKLRVDNDFENDYYRALQDKNSYALNMPEILAQAVRAKSGMDVAKISYDYNKANELRSNLEKQNKPLLDKLDNFAEILKEKEEIKDTFIDEEIAQQPIKKEEKEQSAEKIKKEDITTKTENSVKIEKTEQKTTSKTNSTEKTKSNKSSNTALGIAAATVAVGAIYKLIGKIKAKIQQRRQERQAKSLVA